MCSDIEVVFHIVHRTLYSLSIQHHAPFWQLFKYPQQNSILIRLYEGQTSVERIILHPPIDSKNFTRSCG